MAASTPALEQASTDFQLYRHLDHESDSVRMLTFLPSTSSRDIHCQMDTVSWKDHTEEYIAFISAPSIQRMSQRQRLRAWTENSKRSTLGQTPSLTPEAHQYRFTWGDFATLSYVWGTEPPTDTIIVNGLEVKVRPNLASALRVLAADHRFDAGFHIWVDAICINQHDLSEREQQVARMKDVYGMSWNVISWLGDEADNSKRAFPLLRTLAAARDTTVARELLVSWEENPYQFDDGCWLAMHELVRRPYWCRLWVVQELAMGNKAVTIRCGDDQMDWETFIAGIEALHRHFWVTKDKFILHDMARFYGRPRPIGVHNQHLLYKGIKPLVDNQMRSTGPAHAPLTTLLETAASCGATKKSDKVYGMLAMMDPELTRNISVDYDLAPWKVFANLARAAFTCYDSLELLRECNLCPPEGGPTWAPDWTWPHRERDSRLRREYRADGGRRSAFEVDATGRILTCDVVFADVIDGIGARRTNRYTYQEDSTVQPTFNVSAYGGPEDTKTAFAHAIVGDMTWRIRNDTDERKSLLYLPPIYNRQSLQDLGWPRLAQWGQGYYHVWENWRRVNRDLNVGGSKFDEYFATDPPRGVVEDPLWEAREDWDHIMLNRRFATTRNGLFGWVPDLLRQPLEKQVCKGDLVAIVLGCTTPIVLRPSDQFYLVVGEAYFLGLMDGEGMENCGEIATVRIK